MTTPAPRRMAKLNMQRMSGVDRGANRTQLSADGQPVDGWLVLKADGSPVEETMTEDAQAAIERAEKAEKALADQTAYLEAEAARVAKEAETADLDPVAKALADPGTPDSVRVVLKAQAEAIAKAEADAAEAKKAAETERDTRVAAEYVTKADGLVSHLPTTATDFGPVLRSAAEKMTKAEFDELERVLRAANTQAEAGAMWSEIGTSLTAPAAGSAYGEIVAKADEIRKADPTLTSEKAIEIASTQNPDLVLKHQAEMRG